MADCVNLHTVWVASRHAGEDSNDSDLDDLDDSEDSYDSDEDFYDSD